MNNKLKNALLLAVLLIFSACSILRPGKKDDLPPSELQNFLTAFEKAVLENDTQKVMQLMDREYVKEQHDQMLNGNTSQFIREFFCGNVLDGTGFECVNLLDIDHIKLLSLNENPGHYDVSYEISAKHIRIQTHWVIKEREQNGKQVLGLVGAYG